MSGTTEGVDLSKWQAPDLLDYEALAKTRKFAIVRCAYGTRTDPQFVTHVRRARDAGLAVGTYLFWRSTKPAADQYLTLCEQMDRVRMGPGDLVPAIDIEDDPGVARVSPEWSEPARLLCDAVAGRWTGCLVYLSRRDWLRLGSPRWVEDHSLWPAHWTDAAKPLTPADLPWAIWQYRVGVLPGVYPGPIDQNVARLPLPVIRDPEAERRFVHSWIAETADIVRRDK